MRWIALLRGINVSGQKIIRMEDLVALFVANGYTSVKTYLQTGNVAFDSSKKDAVKLRATLEAQLNQALGYPVTVVLRSQEAIQVLVAQDPFRSVALQDNSKPYITFLAEECTPITLPIIAAKEGVHVIGGDSDTLYSISLLLPNGNYGFPNAYIEKMFKIPATTRNWNTVVKIAK
jgi:uncharacterized protein (DUF1697 family)